MATLPQGPHADGGVPPGGVLPAGALPLPAIPAIRPAAEPIVSLDRVSRTYAMDGIQVDALKDASLAVGQGEFLAIVGPSGSGKSTMMNIIGCLDRPTAGTYRLAGTPVAELSDDGLARLRSRTIGFVFQSYNLLPRTTALDNVATPSSTRASAARSGSPGRRPPSSGSDSAIASTTSRASCPAASSSGSRSPGRSSRTRP